MNIILLGTSYPYRGGLASFNERLTLEFQNSNHNIQIYNFSLQYPNFLFPGKTQYSTSSPPTHLNIQRAVNSVSPLNWWTVGQKIKKEAPDLVIVKYWHPFMAPCFGTILRLVSSNRKTKVICIIDNIIPHEPTFIDRFLTSYFVRSIHAFIGMSDLTLKQLELFDTQKPRRLSPHPIFDNFGNKIDRNSACQNLGIDPNSNYLLFFGFIREYKGLDWLLLAYERVRHLLPNTKLLIAGEFYSSRDSTMQLIDDLNLNTDIILHTHFIEDSQVANYFSCAQLLVLPYKSATQSGVTQIGFHFEIPMLVTDVGGLPEMIQDGTNGILVAPDVDSIAQGLLRFQQMDQAHLKQNIHKDKLKYSWTHLKDSIINLYQQIH